MPYLLVSTQIRLVRIVGRHMEIQGTIVARDLQRRWSACCRQLCIWCLQFQTHVLIAHAQCCLTNSTALRTGSSIFRSVRLLEMTVHLSLQVYPSAWSHTPGQITSLRPSVWLMHLTAVCLSGERSNKCGR